MASGATASAAPSGAACAHADLPAALQDGAGGLAGAAAGRPQAHGGREGPSSKEDEPKVRAAGAVGVTGGGAA